MESAKRGGEPREGVRGRGRKRLGEVVEPVEDVALGRAGYGPPVVGAVQRFVDQLVERHVLRRVADGEIEAQPQVGRVVAGLLYR